MRIINKKGASLKIKTHSYLYLLRNIKMRKILMQQEYLYQQINYPQDHLID